MTVGTPELPPAASRCTLIILAATVVSIGCTTPIAQQSEAPSGAAAATPSESAIDNPTATPNPELVMDAIGEVIVTDLVVRSAPGVGEDSKILEVRLTEGDLVYVVDGPVQADGYDWLLVSEIDAGGAFARAVQGWIAPASREGEPWVVGTQPTCPSEVSVEAFVEAPRPLLLYCFGGDELTLEGALGFCGHGDPVIQEPAWLANYSCAFEAPGRSAGTSEWPIIYLHVEAGADVPSFNGEPIPLRITGRFDVPAAETCRYAEGTELTMPELDELDEALLRFRCRTGFVLESATPISP